MERRILKKVSRFGKPRLAKSESKVAGISDYDFEIAISSLFFSDKEENRVQQNFDKLFVKVNCSNARAGTRFGSDALQQFC